MRGPADAVAIDRQPGEKVVDAAADAVERIR